MRRGCISPPTFSPLLWFPRVRSLTLIAKLLVSVLLLAWVIRQVPFAAVGDALAGADSWLVLLGLAQLSLQPLLGAWRWRVIVQRLGQPIDGRTVLRLTYIGTFVSQTFVSSVGGDAARIWLLRRAGCSLGVAIIGVMLDRAWMLGVLLLMVAAGLPVISDRLGYPVAPWVLISFALAGCAAVAVGLTADRWLRPWRDRKAVSGVMTVAQNARLLLFHPPTAALLALLALLGHFNVMATVWLFLAALGHSLSGAETLLLVPPVVLVSVLPISLGGWGSREAAMVALLALAGVGEAASLAAGLMVGVASIIVVLPGAVLLVAAGRERVGEAN